MRDLARTNLDRVDLLQPGRGMLEAYMFGQGGLEHGRVGGALDYSHRVSEDVSVFANGSVGYGWGIAPGLDWRALTGLRMRF